MRIPTKLLKRSFVVRLSAVVLLATFACGLAAQQSDPAIELFLLTGGYVHGNQGLSPQSQSGSSQLRPQIGGGVLAPLGKKWGALFDVTTSAVEEYWKWDGEPGAGPQDNFAHVRRVVLIPSIVRLWRRDRFSVYVGGGVGFEHDRQEGRLRPIVSRDDHGRPILANDFIDFRATETQAAPAFRAGVIVNLSTKVVARSSYSYLRRYADERGSQGLELGLGYRF